jgi:hypothetical protein
LHFAGKLSRKFDVQNFRAKELWCMDGDMWRNLPLWKYAGWVICLNQIKNVNKLIMQGVLGAKLANVLQSGDGASAPRKRHGTELSEQLDKKWHVEGQL